MRRITLRRRRWLRVLLPLALLIAGAVWLLRQPWVGERLCATARAQLPRLLGGPVEMGKCEVDPLGLGVVVHDVALRSPAGGAPIFAVNTVEASFGAFDFLNGSLQLGRVEVKRPQVHLDLSHPPPPRPGSSEPPFCPLEVLERIGADRLDVHNGSMVLDLPGGRRIEMTGVEVTWRTRRDRVEFRTQARGGVVDLGPGQGSFGLSKFEFAGGLSPVDGNLDVTTGELSLEDFNATLRGQVEGLCDPKLHVDTQLFVPLRAVAKAIGARESAKGQVLARISVSGKPSAPEVAAEVVGTDVAWAIRPIGNFRIRASLANKELKLQEIQVPSGSGAVRISGKMRTEGAFPLELKVEADRAEFGPAIEKGGLPEVWVNFFTSGSAWLRGQLFPFQIKGNLDMHTEHFILTSQSFRLPARADRTILTVPEAKVTSNIEFLADRTEFTNSKIVTPGGGSVAQGSVVLYFDPLRGMKIRGTMPTVDLSDFKELAGFKMSGRGNLGFDVVGPNGDVTIDSTINLRDLLFWDYALGVAQGPLHFAKGILTFPSITGQKGYTQYFGQLELNFNQKDLHVKAHVEVPGGRAEDLIDVIAPLSETVEVFQGALTGKAAGTIDIDAPSSKLAGTMNIDLDELRYDDRRVGKGELRFRFIDGERLTLDRAAFEGPVGTLSARGDYGFGGPLRYRFRAEPLDLGELIGPERAARLGVHGKLILGGRVEGTTDVPQISASLTSPRVTFGERDIGETQLDIRLNGRDLRVWGSPFRDARAEVKIKLKEPYPYSADLNLSLPELRPLLPAVAVAQGVSGHLTAKLHAAGAVKGSAPPDASAEIGQLALARGDFQVANEGPLVFRYSGGKLTAEPFRLVGPNTELAASGAWSRSGLDARVRGALDMRLLESVSSTLERTSGRVELNAAVHGDIAAPLLVGSARVEGVGLSVRGQDLRIRELNGDINFSDARVLIENVEGVFNEGRLVLGGDVELSRFSLKRLGVRAHLDGIALRPLADLPVVASGDLLLTGSPTTQLKLSGDLIVDKLRYEQPIVLESFLQRVLAPRTGAGVQQAREWLALDVGLKLADARVDNNLARARLFGSFRVTGNNLHPGLLGTLEAGAGGFAYFRGNRFDVTQGLMEFKGRQGLDAVFDLHAQTQVQEYTVRLHAFGRTADPKVVFSAEPPLPEGDIVSLLALGITSRDRNNSTAGTSAGLAAEAFLSATGLDRQVERFLPKNAFFRDLSLRVATLYNGATGLVEPTPQLESKLLTEQLKIRIAQPVSGRGTRAQAEYQFTDRLSAQVQWDNEYVDYSYGNLGLDLKLRWDVE